MKFCAVKGGEVKCVEVKCGEVKCGEIKCGSATDWTLKNGEAYRG